MRIPFLICCTIFFVLFSNMALSQSAKQFIGTWFRYNKEGELVEIFIQRNNGDFISNGFDESGALSNLEKGAYEIKKDIIYFRFYYAAEVNKEGGWTILPPKSMEAAHYKYYFKNKNIVNIGTAFYYRK